MHRKKINQLYKHANWKLRLCLLFSFLLLHLPMFSQQKDTVQIGQSFKQAYIGKYSKHRSGSAFKDINDVSGNWEAINSNACWLSPGDTHWIATTLINTDSLDYTMKWYFNNVQAGVIQMYIKHGNSFDTSLLTGSLVPMNERADKDRLFSIPFVLSAGEKVCIYIKTTRKGVGITVTPLLSKLPAEQADWPDIIMIIINTLIFIILLASAYVLIYFPSNEISWFFIYILSGFFYTLAATGFGSMYLWSGFPALEENAAVFFGSISTASLIIFSSLVLKLKQSSKVFFYFIIINAVFHAAAGSAGFLFYSGYLKINNFSAFLAIPYLMMLTCFALLLIYSLYKSIKFDKKFYWFFAIFTSYFVMAIFLTLLELGKIPFDYMLHPLILAFGALPQMILALIFLVFKTISMLKERSLHIQHQRLKAQQEMIDERSRISQDLHDEVGATLSGIAMYSHLSLNQLQSQNYSGIEKSLSIMQDTSVHMVEKLNDIVWFINPGHDNLQQLISRLEDYVYKLAPLKNIKPSLIVSENLLSMEIPADIRKNIFLFCKEACHNAFKYSEASQLTIKFSLQEALLNISIHDNGKGFILNDQYKGNGLNNMKARAAALNAGYTCLSEPGKGTLVCMEIKINK